MADAEPRIMELGLDGFHCSQILLALALEAQGRSNPDLLRAASGLAALGFACGGVCGTLSGACCLLGLYAGKGTADETDDVALQAMLHDLVDWFAATYGKRYGGLLCRDIIHGDLRLKLTRCPEMTAATLARAEEILLDQGYRLSDGRGLPEAG